MTSIRKTVVHPYHTYFKEIVEANSTLTYRAFRCIECLAVLLSIFRLFTIQLAITLQSNQLEWDPVAQFIFNKRHIYNGYLLFCFSFLLLLTFIINWQLFLSNSTGSITWQQVGYDLIVRNVDQAEQCQFPAEILTFKRIQRLAKYQNKIGSLAYLFFRHLISLFTTISSTLALDGLNKQKLHHRTLAFFPFFSVQLRKKLLQFQFLNDWMSWIALSLAFIPFLLALTFHVIWGIVIFPLEHFGPLPGLLLFFDLTLLWIIGFLAIRCTFLITHYLIITSLAYRWHIKASHSMFKNLSKKSNSRHLTVSIWQFLLLKNFYNEHSRISQFIDISNRQMISLSVFSIIMCNTPTNIYFVFRLISEELSFIVFSMILLLVVAQTVAVIILLVPMAQCNGTLYQTAKYIPAIQLSVLQSKQTFALKLKYEIFQDSLTEACLKSGTTVGPLCVVNFESIYKLLVLYVVYLLCFFTLLSK